MSKLDELDLEFEEEFGWARSIPAGGELESIDVDEIKSFSRKYYGIGKQEMKEEADTAIYKLEIMNAEVKRAKQQARLEEREAMKKILEKIEEVMCKTDWDNDWWTGINKLSNIINNQK